MRVARLGDDLAVALPSEVVDVLSLKEGDEVDLRVVGDHVIEVERRMTREEALEKIRSFKKVLPPGWKFDRDEANAR